MKVFREGDFIKVDQGIGTYWFRVKKDNTIEDSVIAYICKEALKENLDIDVTDLHSIDILKGTGVDLSCNFRVTKELIIYKELLSLLRDELLIDCYSIEDELKPEELRQALFEYLSKKPSRIKEIMKC